MSLVTFKWPALVAALALLAAGLIAADEPRPPQRPLKVDPPHISTEKAVKYDYDIVYVRAPRVVKGADGTERVAPVWPNAGEPENLRAATDLMLLHPDGTEEVLVEGGRARSRTRMCPSTRNGSTTRTSTTSRAAAGPTSTR